MSSSSKKTTTNQQTSGTTTGTNVTTPNIPTWLQSPLQGTVSKLVGTDPGAYTPEAANPLQTTAATGASGLGGVGSGALSAAIAAALGLSTAAAPTYTAAQTGSQGYTAAQAAAPGAITSYGYTPSNATGATVGAVSPISGATISTDDIQRLMNPEINNVVNTTLAGFDRQAGQDQASLDAQAGLSSGAFGGSGYALQKSNLTGLNALNRASTEAGLRSQAYDTALSGATTDANNAQQANLSNQATELQRVLAQAGYDQETGEFNAGQKTAAAKSVADAQNSNAQLSAQLAQALGISNASATNAASEFGASAGNTASLTNQAATNTAAGANQQSQLQTLAQRLQAALGVGQLGATQNSIASNAVNTQANLGQTLYGQDVTAQQFPLTFQQQLLQALLGTGAVVDGSTSNVSGTETGTASGSTTSKDNPSLLSTFLGVKSLFSPPGKT